MKTTIAVLCGAAAVALFAQQSWKVAGVDRQMQLVDQVANAGPFRPDWPSLENYEVPRWLQDGKFGIFVHWGPTTINVARGTKVQQAFHEFRPAKFDPTRWAELFRKSGAKFVVPVGEHHDGYAMYDSTFTPFSSVKMHPKRDFLAELAPALRKQGLVFGTSSHYEEHFWFYSDPPKKSPRPPLVARTTPDPNAIPPDQDFLELWLARATEMVDKYQPQMFYFDWQIEQPAFQPYLKKFAAFYYNRAAQWRKGVVLNSKYEAMTGKAGVLDISYNTGRMKWDPAQTVHRFWQFDTMSSDKWFWSPTLKYRPSAELIAEMVDVVSKNGSYLLNFTPGEDGVFPAEQERTMLDFGRWLAVNGDAIYATRPAPLYGEGPTAGVGPAFGMIRTWTPEDFRFTAKGGKLYAIALGCPAGSNGKLAIRSLRQGSSALRGNISRVALLGSKSRLRWTRGGDALTVELGACPGDGLPPVLEIQ